MCDPISASIVGAAVIGGGLSAYSGSKAASATKKAATASEQQAAAQAQRAEQQFNKLNQKQPGIDAMIAANQRAAGRGISSTFLTGPSGVKSSAYSLGGGSLLGGGG